MWFEKCYPRSTGPNESLAKDLLILLSTTPVHRCVHWSLKKGFIYTVIGIVLLTNHFHDIKPSPFKPSVELVSPSQKNQFALCMDSISWSTLQYWFIAIYSYLPWIHATAFVSSQKEGLHASTNLFSSHQSFSFCLSG